MSTDTGRSSHLRGLPGRLLAVSLLGVLLPAGALAAELRQGETVTIGPGEVIDEDLYVVGGTVLIQGTVRGDLVAAGRRVEIPGTVEGDVLSMAGDTVISGQVRGSIRAAAGSLSVAGQVGEDSVLAGGQVRIEPGARVGRDLLLASNEASILAPVGGEVWAAAETLTLGASVDGNVRAEVEKLRVTETARIGGSLRYRADRDAEIASGAAVTGPVERLSPSAERRAGPVMYVIGWLRSVVGLFALGLLLVFLLPDFSRRLPATLRQSPWRSLGWGAVALVGLPLVAALILLVGALLGGWWIGLIALGLYGVALALCFPVVGMFIGRWLLDRFGKAGTPLVLALLLGLALLTLVGRVPVLGALIVLATVLFGLGALVLTAARGRRGMGIAARPQPA
jgi:cytoskeletal protein CcmA (bactofilin family)